LYPSPLNGSIRGPEVFRAFRFPLEALLLKIDKRPLKAVGMVVEELI
jgi:hypothetical protein